MLLKYSVALISLINAYMHLNAAFCRDCTSTFVWWNYSCFGDWGNPFFSIMYAIGIVVFLFFHFMENKSIGYKFLLFFVALFTVISFLNWLFVLYSIGFSIYEYPFYTIQSGIFLVLLYLEHNK